MVNEAETRWGRVRGSRTGGAVVFRAIPYGAPTWGDGRFRPPRPPEAWAGVFDARADGPAAPQCDVERDVRAQAVADLMHPGYGDPLEGQVMSEDCLRVHVWTPGVDDAQRPVMVWLHGGGYQEGAALQTYSQADRLAAAQDVVVVSVSHRLGLLGYTALQDVVGEDYRGSGQAGLLDLVQALEWVHDNISAFGGDPGNVTVFGQSGGGMKVAVLLAMPSAAGLFHRAVIQSGPARKVATREQGARQGWDLLRAFDLKPAGAPRRLAELPLRLLVEYQQRAIAAGNVRPDGAFVLQPSADDATILSDRLTAAATGRQAKPVLVGTTFDESSTFLAAQDRAEDGRYGPDLSLDDVRQHLGTVTGERAAEVTACYQDLYPAFEPYRILARALSDASFRAPSVRLAEDAARAGSPVYMYLFAYEPGALGGVLGACHSADLPFTFGTTARVPLAGTRPDRWLMEEVMGAAWASFARDGAPAVTAAGPWPPYQAGTRATMVLDVVPCLESNPGGAGLAAFDGMPARLFE
jgi:para-nitrobenzyl esterase